MRRLVIGGLAALAAVAIAVVVMLPDNSSSAPPSSGADAGGFAERYQPYSEQALAAAAPQDTVVLFFSAAWCSTCKILRDDIVANQESIPQDVRILLVDFDDATELKTQYGVVAQHTLVQVDRTGQGIARWQFSRSLDDVLATIVEN